jgi:hypothetical protein
VAEEKNEVAGKVGGRNLAEFCQKWQKKIANKILN